MATWFTDDEVRGLQPQLVEMLDEARGAAGVPFVITSGLRTPAENVACGGAPDSAHLRGLAVDLRAEDSHVRSSVVRALYRAGFRRLELCPRHVHADVDPSLPQDVLVLGPDR